MLGTDDRREVDCRWGDTRSTVESTQEIGLKEMMCLESCHSGFGQFETIVRWTYSPFHLT